MAATISRHKLVDVVVVAAVCVGGIPSTSLSGATRQYRAVLTLTSSITSGIASSTAGGIPPLEGRFSKVVLVDS